VALAEAVWSGLSKDPDRPALAEALAKADAAEYDVAEALHRLAETPGLLSGERPVRELRRRLVLESMTASKRSLIRSGSTPRRPGDEQRATVAIPVPQVKGPVRR
jgi:hypothetical protein